MAHVGRLFKVRRYFNIWKYSTLPVFIVFSIYGKILFTYTVKKNARIIVLQLIRFEKFPWSDMWCIGTVTSDRW